MSQKKQTKPTSRKTDSQREDSEEPRDPGQGGFFFWAVAALLWLAYGLWVVQPFPHEWIERFYSRGIYRVVAGVLVPITESVPFSCSLALIALILIAYPACWLACWIYRRHAYGMPHWRGLLLGFKWAILFTPLLLLCFVTFWGAGYSRESAETRLALDQAPITDAESEKLLATLLDIIRRDMPAPENRDSGKALAAVSDAMAEIVQEWDGVPIRMPYRVKATPPGLLLLNSTSGICSPLTLEPHVDGALPDAAFVWVGAHELGHIAGCCGEAEATLIGFAAGLRAKDPFARYAAALDLYIDLARDLGGEKAKAALAVLPEAAKEDRRKASEAAARYNIKWLSEKSWRVYNSYLKAQGVQDGVKNYARGTALFVYAWRKGLTPMGETQPAQPAVQPALTAPLQLTPSTPPSEPEPAQEPLLETGAPPE